MSVDAQIPLPEPPATPPLAADPPPLVRSRLAKLGALMLLIWAGSGIFTVDEREVALILRFGRALPEVANPGFHLKAPWPIDHVLRVDRRLLIFDHEPTELLTRDKKNVLVDSFVCWRIVDPRLFARTLRTRAEAEARLLDLSTAELGAAFGQEPMEGFLDPARGGQRLHEVAAGVARVLDAQTRARFGIEVVDLQVSGFNLPLQNRASVIERMRAERARIATSYRSEGEEQALKVEAASQAERDLFLAQAQGEAALLRAQGEAEAWKIFAEAYRRNPELYQYLRQLESTEKILDEKTTLFLPADAKLLRALELR